MNACFLGRTPFAEIPLVEVELAVMHPLEMEEWKQLLLAYELSGENGEIPEWASARDRALLWVLYDTGMRLSEMCALRLGDVDVEQGMLTVRRDTFKGRRLSLGHEALEAVRVYMEQHWLSGRQVSTERGGISDRQVTLSVGDEAWTDREWDGVGVCPSEGTSKVQNRDTCKIEQRESREEEVYNEGFMPLTLFSI